MSLENDLNTSYNKSIILLRKAEKELIDNYKFARREVRKQLLELFEKFSIKGKLTFQEMSKYNRLSKMFDNINKELNKLGVKNKALQNKLSSNQYQESYYHAAYSIEKNTKLDIGFGELNKEAIEKSVQNPISGLTLNQTLNKNRAEVLVRTRQVLTQGLIRGSSIKQMSDLLNDVFNKDYNKAVRVARTETNRIMNEAIDSTYEFAKNKGINIKRQWVSSLDNRTRDTHAKLDGQYENKNNEFIVNGKTTKRPGGFGIADEDINCRCRTIAIIEGFEPKARRYKRIGIKQYKTFSDWKSYKNIS